MKTKSQSEPQKLEKSLKAPKGYSNTLDKEQDKRVARREKLNEFFNKVVKDKF
jgi:hypothetical protein